MSTAVDATTAEPSQDVEATLESKEAGSSATIPSEKQVQNNEDSVPGEEAGSEAIPQSKSLAYTPRLASRGSAFTGEEEIKAAVVKQVEYYFSKDNLFKDAFLQSQMNADLFVPIQTIATFLGVKKLTDDIQLITEALSTSPKLTLDDSKSMIKPNIKIKRTTVILREIPRDTPQEVLLFLSQNLTPVRK